MDGKSKKVLNFMKKSGADLEAFDVACSLKMDEDAALKILNELKGENLVTSKTDEKGAVFFRIAEEQPAEKRAPKNVEDEAPEPKQKKEKAPRIIKENEVLDIGDFSPQSAPAPAAAPTPKAPTGGEDDFDDFSTKAKPPKKSKVKDIIDDSDDDFEPKAKGLPPAAKPALLAACVVLLLIIAFFLGASSGSGKIKEAVSAVSIEFIKTADFQPVKENTDKISGMEEKLKELEAKLTGVETELSALKQAASKPSASGKTKAGNRRR